MIKRVQISLRDRVRVREHTHFVCSVMLLLICQYFWSEDIFYIQKARNSHTNLVVSYCVLFLAPANMSSASYLETFAESRHCIVSWRTLHLPFETAKDGKLQYMTIYFKV